MLVEVQRSGSPVVVDGVADEFVLQLAEEAEVKAREADRSKLRIATHWAERHQVDDVLKAAHWSDADPRDVCEAIGGAGTPLVHEAAVTPLAAALSVSARAAMQLMSDGLDIKYRLPMTRVAVDELRLAPWRARQIAQLTHRLSPEAAAYVDAKVAPIADTAGPGPDREAGQRSRRTVRHRGAGRRRGRREGSLGRSPRGLLGPHLGRHVPARGDR